MHTCTHIAYPQRPSLRYSLGRPSLMVLAQPGCVWMRTFKASQGARAMSAKNSALADAAKYSEVRHKYAFSCTNGTTGEDSELPLAQGPTSINLKVNTNIQSSPECVLLDVWTCLSKGIPVENLEHLVEPKFAHALE